MTDLSILIPARNEKYLQNTIDDIHTHREADTEIIVVLDGYWPDPPLTLHPKTTIIHVEEPIGQRAAVNMAARVSQAKYVMKLDAHSAVDQGFDVKLMSHCEPDWTVIPRLYNLHVFDWICESCGLNFYQADHPGVCTRCHHDKFSEKLVWSRRVTRKTDFSCFDHEMHFQYWRRYYKRKESEGDIADLMSSLGACFFMERDRFWQLGGLDEAHGFWGQFGTEIACKSWLSGGRHVVNKKTWYSHYFRVGKLKFPYELSGNAQERARIYSRDLWLNNKWPKQIHPLKWLIDKFAPAKYWHDPEGESALAYITRAAENWSPVT